MSIKGRLLSTISYDKPVFVHNFKSCQNKVQSGDFRGKWRSKDQIIFVLNPKCISLRAIASFDVFFAKICVRISAVDDWEKPAPLPKNR